MVPIDPSVVEPSGRYTHADQTSTLHLGDVKSRKDNQPLHPKMDHSSNHTQLMIYKSLLDGMILSAYPDTGCTYEATFPCVFERTFRDLCLDVDRQFSNGFLEELGKLEEPSFSKLGCRLPKGIHRMQESPRPCTRLLLDRKESRTRRCRLARLRSGLGHHVHRIRLPAA